MARGEPAQAEPDTEHVTSNNGRSVYGERGMSVVVFGAMIAVLGGLFIVWLAIRMWRERLPRNPVAGVRTRSAMRSDEAFRIANKAAAPPTIVGGVVLIAGGLAAALLPEFAGVNTLLASVVTFGGLCVAGGVKGSRASRVPVRGGSGRH